MKDLAHAVRRRRTPVRSRVGRGRCARRGGGRRRRPPARRADGAVALTARVGGRGVHRPDADVAQGARRRAVRHRRQADPARHDRHDPRARRGWRGPARTPSPACGDRARARSSVSSPPSRRSPVPAPRPSTRSPRSSARSSPGPRWRCSRGPQRRPALTPAPDPGPDRSSNGSVLRTRWRCSTGRQPGRGRPPTRTGESLAQPDPTGAPCCSASRESPGSRSSPARSARGSAGGAATSRPPAPRSASPLPTTRRSCCRRPSRSECRASRRSACRTATSTASTPRSPSPRSTPRRGRWRSAAWSTGPTRSRTTTCSRMPLVERDLTLTCVSNEVGGQYAGNARWLGVRVKDLLAHAGVDPGADQLLSRSIDGWSASTPIAAVTDGRDAIVAVAMNGEPLPAEHGFPARMVVPGSTASCRRPSGSSRSSRRRTPRSRRTGLAAAGPPTPRSARWPASTCRSRSRRSPPGAVAVAGVCWAQHRGIDGVEVQVDDGPWRTAKLGSVPSDDTWRQWVVAWDATPGRHTLRARATDGTGRTQPVGAAHPVPQRRPGLARGRRHGRVTRTGSPRSSYGSRRLNAAALLPSRSSRS